MTPSHCIFKLIDNRLSCGVVELPVKPNEKDYSGDQWKEEQASKNYYAQLQQAIANAIWFREEKDVERMRQYAISDKDVNWPEIDKPFKLPNGVEIEIGCKNCIHLQGQEESPDCCHKQFAFLKQPKEQETNSVCAKCGGNGYWTYYSTNEKVKCDCGIMQEKEESQDELWEEVKDYYVKQSIIRKGINQIFSEIGSKFIISRK